MKPTPKSLGLTQKASLQKSLVFQYGFPIKIL